MLPEPQVAAADAAHRQGLPAASLGDWRVLTNGAGQGALPEAGDSNSLLFCSKYWLIEVDRNTGATEATTGCRASSVGVLNVTRSVAS